MCGSLFGVKTLGPSKTVLHLPAGALLRIGMSFSVDKNECCEKKMWCDEISGASFATAS